MQKPNLVLKDSLEDLLSNPDYTQRDKILIIIGAHETPLKNPEIKEAGIANGLREIERWNITNVLRRAKKLVIPLRDGWSLTTGGRRHLEDVGAVQHDPLMVKTASALRAHLSTVQNSDVQEFLDEAIFCFEAKKYRAAVVLSWVGAVATLQEHVWKNSLPRFNAAGFARFGKNFREVKTEDDFVEIKEFNFLQISLDAGVFDKNVKTELEGRLKLRNSCGHPNKLKIAEATVASHIEVLVLNVFSRYG